MSIALATIRTNIFSEVYSILNTKLVDPLSRSKQWIFSSIPDIEQPTFVGYPFLVIKRAKISKERLLLNDSYSDKYDIVTIQIFSTANSVVDSLTDAVDVLMTPSNFSQFDFIDYNEDNDDLKLGGNNVHVQIMNYTIGIMRV